MINGRLFCLLLIVMLFTGCNPPEKIDRKKLILVSIDGFRNDYIDLYDTPNLDRIKKKGVHAEFMIPVFPSKTYPNHYSIVTGLYAENHGIISNRMYDNQMGAHFSLADRNAVRNPDWYDGEPIWLTAEKQGLPTAPMFWPGSEAPLQGVYATKWYPYEENLPYSARVDSVISWLQLKDKTAPYFMTLYFSKVDTFGHWYGPESDSVAAAVLEVDREIGNLLDRIQEGGLDEEVNLIIVSDHGMSELSEKRMIILDELINMEDVTILDLAPVTMIEPNENKAEKVYMSLKESENHFKVYRKLDLPEHYRLKNNYRVPSILVVSDPGYSIVTKEWLVSGTISGGNHGYDPNAIEMRSLFLAAGPSFKEGYVSKPFQNIHVYEIMTKALKITPAPNDGMRDSVIHLFNMY